MIVSNQPDPSADTPSTGPDTWRARARRARSQFRMYMRPTKAPVARAVPEDAIAMLPKSMFNRIMVNLDARSLKGLESTSLYVANSVEAYCSENKVYHLNLSQCTSKQQIIDKLKCIKDVSKLKITGLQKDTKCGWFIEALADSAHLSSLTSLDLWGNNIGDEGARAIANSAHFSSLTSLNLRRNTIGPEGATAIANSAYLSALTLLDLSANNIRDEGATAIANSAHLSSLTSLNLSSNNIRDEGATAIANSAHLSSLTSLGLWGNNIRDEGATAIANSAHLSSLKSLDLSANKIGNEERQSIRRLFPFAIIERPS
jgi:Leucine-rich repeat (LRR) protein